MDAFDENILGATSLVSSDTNKIKSSTDIEEGIDGDYENLLELPMSNEELLSLRDEYEAKSNGYYPKIKARQNRNKLYLKGNQRANNGQNDLVVPKNLLFEATATFVPAALAENPEPVVFSDNTEEGKQASNDLKTMLQYHADTLGMRQKLAVMVWQWSEYFVGAVKYGWEPLLDKHDLDEDGEPKDKGDITMELRKPQNLVLDPDGYVDEFGDFHGWIGDRIEKPAKWFIEKFPTHKEFITIKVNDKLGTLITATEWCNDEFTFTTFQDVVLEKHKNEFFNYPKKDGAPVINHFAAPKKPYTFFSVYSLQEEPYDFTNLIEQNIANQDRINDRDEQITKNLASGNNAVAISGQAFTSETADQAVQTFYQEGFLLIPDGNMDAVKRIPASALPNGIMEAQASDMQALRSVYGTSGLVPNQNPDEAVRNNIMNEQHDSSRIGGGVGDRLEITAKNMFNWLTQLYAVFYDVPHYGAIMGNAAAVQYVQLSAENLQRKFVVSVAPNSMKPHDETSQMNLAVQRWEQKAIDPINFLKELDDPDPLQNALMLVTWTVNPQQYMQQFLGGEQQPQQPQQGAPQVGGAPPEGQPIQQSPPQSPAAPIASPSLSQVPLPPLNK